MADFKDLPKDLQDKMVKWEEQSPANLQLKALQEIVKKTQLVVSELNNLQVKDEKNSGNMGSLLIDIRESLDNMAAQEAPEAIDYSTPIVDAVLKLEKALNASIKTIDVKPNVNVASPNVKIDVPKLDLSKIEKILKTDIPKAFQLAIKSIPSETPDDYTPLIVKFDEMFEILQSIDTASRMKPAPGVIKVTNPDGSAINSAIYDKRLDDTTTLNMIYIGEAVPGTATSAATWRIKRLNVAIGLIIEWSGNGDFTQVWNNRASLTYN